MNRIQNQGSYFLGIEIRHQPNRPFYILKASTSVTCWPRKV